MPIFTAAATALLSSTALAGSLIATNIVASVLAIGTGKLLGVFDTPNIGGAGAAVDEGVDIRLQPNPQNRLPLMYGDYQARGVEIYATASNEGQKVHYVLALGEITKMASDTTDTTIDSFYWEDYELNVDTNQLSATFGAVTGARLSTDPVNTFPEAKFNGIIEVRAYPTGGPSAFLSGIAPTDEWTVADHRMTDVVYVVVSLTYNRDAGVTGLATMRFRGTAPISNPAVAARDLLTNTRYGLALDDATYVNSVTDLNDPRSRYSFATIADYFDETFTPFDDSPADNIRSRIDGLVSTNATVATRIETILRGGYGALRWNNGLFSIFVNREDSTTSFVFDDSNIVGSITVTEPGFETFYTGSILTRAGTADNNFEDIIDEIDVSDLPFSSVLNIRLPLTRSASEAAHRANNALRLGAEQFSIMHRASIDAFPVEVGDIVSYDNDDFGWNSKLFRIIKKTLSESTGGLFFDIEAIEYDDAQYIETDDIPVDLVPNTGNPGVQTLPPVDDLATTGTFRSAATPYIALSWTVPSTGFFEEFDVFFNNQTDNFNSNATVFGGSVRNTGVNSYTNGDMLTFDLVGVPAGDVSIWVRGRNDYTRSVESNRAFVNNWDPVSAPANFEIINRYNETPSVIDGLDIDVGAPPANATGIGTGRNNLAADTGWYEFDAEASDRENAPVWTATTETERVGVEFRDLNFGFSGVSGAVATVEVDTNQERDFVFDGTVGQRTEQYPARPEITDFTLTGTSADTGGLDPGTEEIWKIAVSGDTEIDANAASEEFFIYPSGTSNTASNEQHYILPSGTAAVYTPQRLSVTPTGNTNTEVDTPEFVTITPSGNTSDGLPGRIDFAGSYTFLTTFTGADNTVIFQENNGDVNGVAASLIRMDYAASDEATLISEVNATFGTSFVAGDNETDNDITQGLPIVISTGGVEDLRVTNLLRIQHSATSNAFLFIGTREDNTGTPPANNTIVDVQYLGDAAQSTVTIELGDVSQTYSLTDNLVGEAAVGADLNTMIGTDFSANWTKALDATTGVITFTANDLISRTSNSSFTLGSNGTIAIALVTEPPIIRVGSSVTITVPYAVNPSLTTTFTYELSDNLVGGAAIGAELFNMIGDDFGYDWTLSLDASTGVITYESKTNVALLPADIELTFVAGTDGTFSAAIAIANNPSLTASTVTVDVNKVFDLAAAGSVYTASSFVRSGTIFNPGSPPQDVVGTTWSTPLAGSRLETFTDLTHVSGPTSGSTDHILIVRSSTDWGYYVSLGDSIVVGQSQYGGIDNEFGEAFAVDELMGTKDDGMLKVYYFNEPIVSEPDTFNLQNIDQVANTLEFDNREITVNLQTGLTGDALVDDIAFKLGQPQLFRTLGYTFDTTNFTIDGTSEYVVRITLPDELDYVVSGSETGGTLDATYGQIAAVNVASTVTIVITTDSINETITVGSDLTGTDLFLDIMGSLSANTNITDEFTVGSAQQIVDGTEQTVITLTANDNTNHSLMTTSTGPQLMIQSGSITDGTEATVTTTITIAFDADINADDITLTFSANATAADVASELVSNLILSGGSAVQTDGFTVVSTFGDDDLAVDTSLNAADSTSNDIFIKAAAKGDMSAPVITVDTQGTGTAAFVVTTELEGRPDLTGNTSPTMYNVTLDGTALTLGSFADASTSSEAATALGAAINGLAEFTASVSGSVVTATSVANSSDNITVSITTGVNGPDATSPNDLAVSRSVTQIGTDVAVFGGQDATIQVVVDNRDYYLGTYAGTAITDIITDLESGIDTPVNGFPSSVRWNATKVDATTLKVEAIAVGTGPSISLAIDAGSTGTSSGAGIITETDATLASAVTIIDDGTEEQVVSGELSTFRVNQDSDEVVAATSFTSGSNPSSMATQVASAITAATTNYTTSVSGPVMSALSDTAATTPDLTVFITQGKDVNDVTSTDSVAKTVVQAGDPGTIDLTDAVWTYAITGPTVDGDLIDMNGNGVITARRGVVLNSESVGGVTADYVATEVEIDTIVVVGDRPAVLEVAGAAIVPCISTTTAGSYISITLQISTNPNDATPVFTDVYTTPQFPTVVDASIAGQLLTPSIPLAATIDVDANSSFLLKAVRNDVNPGSGGIYLAALVLEELRAT